jgi:hypothetical protein
MKGNALSFDFMPFFKGKIVQDFQQLLAVHMPDEGLDYGLKVGGLPCHA